MSQALAPNNTTPEDVIDMCKKKEAEIITLRKQLEVAKQVLGELAKYPDVGVRYQATEALDRIKEVNE